jgi:hypothetical protein
MVCGLLPVAAAFQYTHEAGKQQQQQQHERHAKLEV